MVKKRDKRISETSRNELEMAATAAGLQIAFCSHLCTQIDRLQISDDDKSSVLWTTILMSVEALFSENIEDFICHLRETHQHNEMMRRPVQ